MVRVRLSRRAETDLAEIADFTIKRFGIEQARHYRNGLETLFERVAEHPLHGRGAAELAPGMRRIEYESHIVFYVPGNDGVRIVRILHQSMDVKRRL